MSLLRTRERTRVLQVIARLNVGGPALVATVLSDGLDRDRFDQLLVAGSVADDEGDFVELRAPHLEVSHVRGLGRAPRPLDDLRALEGVIKEIRRFRPHIVHTHTAKAGALGRVAARMCGVPATVHTFHGHVLTGYFSRMASEAVVLTERGLARHTSRLLAVGDQVRRDLLAAGIGRPDQYDVIAPGVSLKALPSRPTARSALGLPGHATVVTFVARLTAIKRPERFLELAALLFPTHPDAVFLVVGDGELAPALTRQARASGAPIRFLGWRSDVECVYSASDVVVLTSDNEGMPVSLIEAQMAGRPCVTTRVGGAPEVVLDGQTGYVTGPHPRDLAQAVERLLLDPVTRHSFGTTAARRAQTRFGADRLVDDMTRIYAQVLQPRPAGLPRQATAQAPF